MSSIKIKKAYADLAEGQIHYRYTPSTSSCNKTPIVFLHKSASSSYSYTTLQTHYAQLNYPTYAPDLPGFGQSFTPSPSPSKPLTTAWYCEVLFAFLSSLNLKKFHLVGHHSGACLSLELAVLFPDSVQSITLIGPTLMSAEERLAMKARFFAPFNEPVASGDHLLKTWTYLKKMGCPSSSSEDLEMLQQEFLDHASAWRGRTLIYGAVWEQDGQALFRQVKCRVLAMCARDDVLWDFWHWVGELTGEGMDVREVVVRGANFECELDAEGVTGALDGFLEG